MATDASMQAVGIQEFSVEHVVRALDHAHSNGSLREALRSHWTRYVPQIFCLGGEPDPAKEESETKSTLFRPMEMFICGGEPEAKFTELKLKDSPPQLCGHVFKMGEPTYACRDCGMDATCVLCIDCFQKSIHKKHRYRMSTSGGGGYCDCGDSEAWKSDPCCDQHKRGLQQENKNSLDNLPVDLRGRVEEMFLFTLEYAVELLTWEAADTPPGGMEKPQGDSFCTMVFNDEVHTYEQTNFHSKKSKEGTRYACNILKDFCVGGQIESLNKEELGELLSDFYANIRNKLQVINTLQRAVDCVQKEAVEFATTIDREGRSIVKSGTFLECETAKNIIERTTSRHGGKPLKVQVIHTTVVAHQDFAQRLLPWLKHVTTQCDGFRKVFCNLAMKPSPPKGHSILQTILLADTCLWKVARVLAHQLFMSGVLLDQESKKQFAIIFTLHYPKLMKDFIQDDHDQSVSVTSESVQIYTVPTLARMLIKDYDLLEIIMKAFLEECQAKKNRDGKFAFERNDRNQGFRRAQYMLYDLKYCLSCKPTAEEWCDDLRRSYLCGFKVMLELLSSMQGMDPVQRQTGQHLEFEPEWEGAFNLQLKLADVISLMLQWCSTDVTVLTSAFTATVDALYSCKDPSEEVQRETRKVGGHEADVIKYDVGTQKVSIHLPLSRICAGLLPYFDQFGLSIPQVLKKRKLSAVELIEPSLRALVMIAQTQAGMWRRNGYSLLNQIYFYHNVRCRGEMYDQDIVMLQGGAALLDPNEFLIHLINKFGLLQWSRADYDRQGDSQDDCVRQTVTVAEELLNLLIIMLSERYVQGVGQVTGQDKVKREVVHQLCIQPMAHSELVKALPEDVNHETGIEDVVSLVADFKKPTGSGKGLYEVKLDCYKFYSPFFYHYTRSDQSKSEEQQRKRKKAIPGEDQALAPPIPPGFSKSFASVESLLQCDVMIYIIKLILSRTAAKRSRSWSDTQFEKVLFLVGLALHAETAAHERGTQFGFLERAVQGEQSITSILDSLVGHPNATADAPKDLLAWVRRKLHSVHQLKDSSVAMDAISTTSSAADEKLEKEKQRKANVAKQRRARIMQQIADAQKHFIKQNEELFNSTPTDLKTAVSDMDVSHAGTEDTFVAVGTLKNQVTTTGPNHYSCILCQEEQDVTHNDRAMVLAAYVQKSTVLSKTRGKIVENADEYEPLFMDSDLFCGPFTSSCGHIMHSDCWQRFYDSILAKERRRPLRFRHHLSYDIDKAEFLCPLCESLSNTVIPLIPPLPSLIAESERKEVDLSLNDWLDGIQKTVQASVREAKDEESEEESFMLVPCPLSTITKMMAESVAKNFQLLFDYVYDDTSAHFSDSITDMLRKFSRDVYAIGLGVNPDDDNIRVPVVAWGTCAFTIQATDISSSNVFPVLAWGTCASTIQATEQGLRDEKKPLFGALSSRHNDCLSALVRFAAVCSQVFQLDIMKKHCLKLISALFPESAERKMQDVPGLLDLDMFQYLVKLSLSLPTLYANPDDEHTSLTRIATGGLNDQHAIQLVYTAHLVQIMLTADFHDQDAMETEADANASLVKEFHKLRTSVGYKTDCNPSAWQLICCIKEASMPFLRSAAMFYHYLTNVQPPPQLQEGEGSYEVLCAYLSLPEDPGMLFCNQGPVISQLIESWCREESVKRKLSASSEVCIRYPLTVNQLILLPQDYSELINCASTFTCPKSDGEDSRAPTMCLVCGKMLCSQSYCCQTELDGQPVGAATAHAHSCGAGVGMFLRVRECQVLLLSGRTKGCFFAPPYLDDYGETDQGLRRGNPLHLCPERYRKLQKLWMSHSIPEEIAHLLESNSNLMSIDWQHL